jgi:radical SAM/Cys-rich protein
MRDSRPYLLDTDFPALTRGKLETVQVNLGYLCNLSFTHCHVNAGPHRKELMTRETIDQILAFIDLHDIKTLDLTGGAPELNPEFRYFVEQARLRDVHVMDRCNLTVLLEEGQEDLAAFLAKHKVEVVASLPCYTEDNVDAQRGKGVFDKSIDALQALNAIGYGHPSSTDHLTLSLVYNPGGAFLPPPQEKLEADYHAYLHTHFGIVFDELYTITNMPISRFGAVLLAKGKFDEYMSLLKASYSQSNLKGVMCRTLISIDWQGYVFDCDFNQMLDMPIALARTAPADTTNAYLIASDKIAKQTTHISDLLTRNLFGESIVVADHCYGCTAGQGSSCGGALD